MPATPVRRAALAAALTLTIVGVALPRANASALIPQGKHFGFNSQLGAWYDGVPSSGVTPDTEATMIRTAGGDTQRLAVSWTAAQPTRPPANGPQLPAVMPTDASVRALVARGMRPVITIIDAPLWASEFATCRLLDLMCLIGREVNDHLAPARWAVPAYVRFVRALAVRYPTAHIETWNEPNEARWWQDGYPASYPNPQLMAQLQCAAYDAIKQVGNPEQLVLGPGLGNALVPQTRSSMVWLLKVQTSTATLNDFASAMYSTMGRTCWDRFNVHLYYDGNLAPSGTPFAQSWDAIRSARSAAVPVDQTPIWVTETGISTSGPQPATPEVQHTVQTDGVLIMLAMSDVEAVLVNTLRDAPSPGNAVNPYSTEYGFGMLYADTRPKAAYCTYVQAAHTTYPGC